MKRKAACIIASVLPAAILFLPAGRAAGDCILARTWKRNGAKTLAWKPAATRCREWTVGADARSRGASSDFIPASHAL